MNLNLNLIVYWEYLLGMSEPVLTEPFDPTKTIADIIAILHTKHPYLQHEPYQYIEIFQFDEENDIPFYPHHTPLKDCLHTNNVYANRVILVYTLV